MNNLDEFFQTSVESFREKMKRVDKVLEDVVPSLKKRNICWCKGTNCKKPCNQRCKPGCFAYKIDENCNDPLVSVNSWSTSTNAMMLNLMDYLRKTDYESFFIKGSHSLTVTDDVKQKIKGVDSISDEVYNCLVRCFKKEHIIKDSVLAKGFHDSRIYGPNPFGTLAWFGELILDRESRKKEKLSSVDVELIKLYYELVTARIQKSSHNSRDIEDYFRNGIQGMRAAFCYKLLDKFRKKFVALVEEFQGKDQETDRLIKQYLRPYLLQHIYQHLTSFEIEDGLFDPAELTFCMEALLVLDEGRHYIQPALLNQLFEVMKQALDGSAFWKPTKPYINTDKGEHMLPLSAEVANSLLRICILASDDERELKMFQKHKDMFHKYTDWVLSQVVKIHTRPNIPTLLLESICEPWHKPVESATIVPRNNAALILDILEKVKAIEYQGKTLKCINLPNADEMRSNFFPMIHKEQITQILNALPQTNSTKEKDSVLDELSRIGLPTSCSNELKALSYLISKQKVIVKNNPKKLKVNRPESEKLLADILEKAGVLQNSSGILKWTKNFKEVEERKKVLNCLFSFFDFQDSYKKIINEEALNIKEFKASLFQYIEFEYMIKCKILLNMVITGQITINAELMEIQIQGMGLAKLIVEILIKFQVLSRSEKNKKLEFSEMFKGKTDNQDYALDKLFPFIKNADIRKKIRKSLPDSAIDYTDIVSSIRELVPLSPLIAIELKTLYDLSSEKQITFKIMTDRYLDFQIQGMGLVELIVEILIKSEVLYKNSKHNLNISKKFIEKIKKYASLNASPDVAIDAAIDAVTKNDALDTALFALFPFIGNPDRESIRKFLNKSGGKTKSELISSILKSPCFSPFIAIPLRTLHLLLSEKPKLIELKVTSDSMEIHCKTDGFVELLEKILKEANVMKEGNDRLHPQEPFSKKDKQKQAIAVLFPFFSEELRKELYWAISHKPDKIEDLIETAAKKHIKDIQPGIFITAALQLLYVMFKKSVLKKLDSDISSDSGLSQIQLNFSDEVKGILEKDESDTDSKTLLYTLFKKQILNIFNNNNKSHEEEKDYYGWHSEHVMMPLHRSKFIHLWATREYLIYLMQYRALCHQDIASELIEKNGFTYNPVKKPKYYINSENKVVKWDNPKPEEYWKNTINPGFDTMQGSKLAKNLNVYQEILKRFVNRENTEDCYYSMLLYGPPGTGKTTIAEKLAEALDWPLITVTPSDFIRDGGSLVEARAKQIFKSLCLQQDSVILLDEIDRLILDRDAPMYHNQNDTFQFMTPSMLVKLQDLRKGKRVIFIICTNYEERIDLAAKRKGRIDEQFLVLPPDKTARSLFLFRELIKNHKDVTKLYEGNKSAKDRIFAIIDFVSDKNKDHIQTSFNEISKKTFGYCYGDLKNLYIELLKYEEIKGMVYNLLVNIKNRNGISMIKVFENESVDELDFLGPTMTDLNSLKNLIKIKYEENHILETPQIRLESYQNRFRNPKDNDDWQKFRLNQQPYKEFLGLCVMLEELAKDKLNSYFKDNPEETKAILRMACSLAPKKNIKTDNTPITVDNIDLSNLRTKLEGYTIYKNKENQDKINKVMEKAGLPIPEGDE